MSSWDTDASRGDAAAFNAAFPGLGITLEDHETLHAALAFVDDYELSETEEAFGDKFGNLELRVDAHVDSLRDSAVRVSSEIAMVQPADARINTMVKHETLTEQASQSNVAQHVPREAITTPTASTTSTETSTTKRNTNRSRTRQRDELLYLRGKVDELEERLSTLKKRGEGDENAGSGDDSASQQLQEPLAFVWEELASRQYEQRQRSEVENIKLRTMLEEQIRVAKNLERLLKKRTMTEFLLPPHAKRVRKWNDSSRLDEPDVFDELDATVSEMYSQLEAVYADERFACRTPALRDIQARHHEEFGTVVEVFDSRVSPFGIQAISDAVWHHMAMQSLDAHAFHNHLLEISGDSFRREFGASLDMPRLKGSFRGKIVAKRFVEEDRVVVLWAALVDPDKVSEMPMDGLLMRQKGWTLIRPTPPNFVKGGRQATVTQSYHMIIPEYEHDEDNDHRRKVGTLTNFVLNSVDFHLETGRQMIENLLLEEGWKTPSSNPSSPEETAIVPSTTTTN